MILSVAFAFSYQDGIFGMSIEKLPVFALISFIAVGIGFLAHELIGHKAISMRYGFHAEYRMWQTGLFIAFITSLFGFVFAAPGAVHVSPRVDLWGQPENVSRRKMGIVSMAGPVVNIILAAIFYILNTFSPLLLFGESVFGIAMFVNVWLALFNMLPIPPLDGSKVFVWDRRVWMALFAACIGVFAALTAV